MPEFRIKHLAFGGDASQGLLWRTLRGPRLFTVSSGKKRHMVVRVIGGLGLVSLMSFADANAQFATVGAGVLMSKRSPEPVAELHAETPPLLEARGYVTLSWTDESARPTVITAGERSLGAAGPVMAGFGAGLLWLDVNDYRPYPILVSSTVFQLPIPRTSLVAIASTQPFQDFEWSLVVKVGVTVWFLR